MADWKTIDNAQWQVIRSVIRGKRVVQLGGGQGWFAEALADHASRVENVDRYPYCRLPASRHHQRLMTFAAYAREAEPADVVVLIWPTADYESNLAILQVFTRTKPRRVIYVGGNRLGKLTGHPVLFDTFEDHGREANQPGKECDLLVYNTKARDMSVQAFTEEEMAGLKI
jgi:hypothetical protein